MRRRRVWVCRLERVLWRIGRKYFTTLSSFGLVYKILVSEYFASCFGWEWCTKYLAENTSLPALQWSMKYVSANTLLLYIVGTWKKPVIVGTSSQNILSYSYLSRCTWQLYCTSLACTHWVVNMVWWCTWNSCTRNTCTWIGCTWSVLGVHLECTWSVLEM